MTVSDGIHLSHQDSHSCAIDDYNELVFILRIRTVLTLCDMDSKGCLYPSSRDNLSTDLGCILHISSSANFLHVHSTKHFWCVTPSGQWSRFDPGLFLDWLDRLTGAVEEMTRQMRQVADATRSVAKGNEQLTAGLETFLEECCFFTAPWGEDKELEDREVEADLEEVKQEVQGLHEEQENPDGAVLE